MDGILKIHQSLLEGSTSYLNIYKKALTDHQSFYLNNANSIDPVVQHITSLLNKPKSRYEGLLLLKCLLQQCSLHIIDQKGSLWTTSCIKICNQKENGFVLSFAYDSLRVLIKKSTLIPELCKSFSNNFVGKICETLANIESGAHLSALKCLEITLKTYPGPCGGNAKIAIERFLTKNFVDCEDQNLVIWSGKCLHLLQQVRGGGVQGVSHKAAWQAYHLKLLGSLHKILDVLFENCQEVYDGDSANDSLNINPLELSNEPISRTAQLTTRFKSLLNYLIVAIREPFPVAKGFQIRKILNLIARGLFVNCHALQRNLILDNIVVGAVLPDIHVQLYKVLEALILTLKSHLAMFHQQILSFISDTLMWTSSGKSGGFKKPYSDLRILAYETLSLWCKTMKFGSCAELIYENLIKQIDGDITGFQNEMTLKVLSGARKHMSKKARRQLHKAQNEKSHLVQTHSKTSDSQNMKVNYSDEGNQLLCIAALECLKNIYTYSSCFLKPIAVKEIQEKIVLICLNLNESQDQNEALYSNDLCRKSAYGVLNCLIMSPNYLCPPPTQLAVQLFTIGQIKDYSEIVRTSCADHLNKMEKILHPQKQCLYFPPDLIDIKNANKLRTNISDSEDDETDNEEELNDELDNSQRNTVNLEENTVDSDDNIIEEEMEEETEINNNEEQLNAITDAMSDSNDIFLQNVDEQEINKNITLCPKKRLLQKLENIQLNQDDEIIEDDKTAKDEDDTGIAPKRPKLDTDEKIIESTELNDEGTDVDVHKEQDDKTSTHNEANVEDEKVEIDNDDLVNQMVATFTDELKSVSD